MSILGLNRAEFHALTNQILSEGHKLRFRASGDSMQPFIHDGDILEVSPASGQVVHCGDVLLVDIDDGRLLVHRVIKTRQVESQFSYLIQGDNCSSMDGWFQAKDILGRVVQVRRGNREIDLTSLPQRYKARVWVTIKPFAPYFYWLPGSFRQFIRNWLSV